MPEAALEGMADVLGHQRITIYMDVATFTVLAYEIITNLAVEIELIWMSKWTFVTVLYLVQRYLPLFDTLALGILHNFRIDLSPRICTIQEKIMMGSMAAGIALSEILLTLRVWAVWERKIAAAIGLIGFFLACWVPITVPMMLFLNTLKFATLLHPNFSGCVLTGASPTIYVAWILLMVYDTGMLVMMLIPGVDAYRRGGRSELATTIYRDGVMYYMFLCLFSLINVIFISTLPDELIFLLTTFERVLHSALASRAILHIRQVVRRNVSDTILIPKFMRDLDEVENVLEFA